MNVVIIGNGIAGITCALEIRRRDERVGITVIGGETEYFFSRTALMYAYQDAMTRRDLEPYERASYAKKRIQLVHDWVTDIDRESRSVRTASGETLRWDKLVIACGAAPCTVEWPGMHEVERGIVHFVSMQDLDACEALTPSTNMAVVVGGGLIGIELVECLRHHGKEVHFLIREPYYWPAALAREEAGVVERCMEDAGVRVHSNTELAAVEADTTGRVCSVTTTDGDTLSCEMLGVCIGVEPNVRWLAGVTDAPAIEHGILVDETFQTSMADVFAAGDCCEIVRDGHANLIETIWYSARAHGRCVARNVFGDGARYTPPIFYNSSKFFDIEFTTVGAVVSAPVGTPTIYLKNPKGDQSVRIVHSDEKVIGFNMLGTRWDHTMLSRWIAERRDPAWVLDHLRAAQFDVEFGRARLERFERQDLPLQPRGSR